MNDVLRPFTSYRTLQLAEQLRAAVGNHVDFLRGRNIHGPRERYFASQEIAIENIEKAKENHRTRKMGHFTIVNALGEVVGAASIDPNLRLRKLPITLPPFVIPGFMTNTYPELGPNVTAWAPRSSNTLTTAYAELTAIARTKDYQGDHRQSGDTIREPWTVEPIVSPKYVVEAITATSGLAEVARGRFDDAESQLHWPPPGILYAYDAEAAA